MDRVAMSGNEGMNPSEIRALVENEFLKLMESHFPLLCQLEHQKGDPGGSSDNPPVAKIGDHGAEWGPLLPKGSEDGDCLVWIKGKYGGGRWEPGEGGGTRLPNGIVEGQVLVWHFYSAQEKQALDTTADGAWQPGWVMAVDPNAVQETAGN